MKLTLVANREVPDAGVDGESQKAVAAALDDLRRLGRQTLRPKKTPDPLAVTATGRA